MEIRESKVGAPSIRIPDHELFRQIGSGSYGEVWLARSALGTFRAVKIDLPFYPSLTSQSSERIQIVERR